MSEPLLEPGQRDELVRLGAHVRLVREIAESDPWGPEDSEYGSSSCHYCDSHLVEKNGGYRQVAWVHHTGCLWMRAVELTGVEQPGHSWYVAPEPEPVCEVCGYQGNNDEERKGTHGPDSTGTLTAHFEHQARDAGFRTVNEWLDHERHAWQRAMLASFGAQRGGISFVRPPSIDGVQDLGVKVPLIYGDDAVQVGTVESVTETPEGLLVVGTIEPAIVAEGGVCAPIWPMYDPFHNPEHDRDLTEDS